MHEILGRAYERKQDYPNAIRTYTKAIALGVEVHYAPLINLCCEANLHDEGIAIIKKAIKTKGEKALKGLSREEILELIDELKRGDK